MVAASQVLSGDAKKQSSSLYNSYFFIVFEMVLGFKNTGQLKRKL